MKKLTKNLIMTAFLAVITLAGSLFTASNFPVQVAVAQTTVNAGGGPQDGGDGKKKKCRPPRQCPTGGGSGQVSPDSTEPTGTDESESSDWWDDFIDWLFGE